MSSANDRMFLLDETRETNSDSVEQFTIGDLAREFGVTLRALRFYEDKGLLNPTRQGTMRLYNRRDRARLKLVLMGKKVGFSLAEIKDMLDLYDLEGGQITQLQVAHDRFAGQIDILKAQRADIDEAIDELSRTVQMVADMLGQRRARAAKRA